MASEHHNTTYISQLTYFMYVPSLTLPLFIEVSVLSKETVMYLCVRGIDFTYLFNFSLDFGNVPTVRYFLFLIFLSE